MKAKKSLGQNFLINPNIADRMVADSFVKESDVVVEIGPGKGALTEKILETGATVIAIEKDSRLPEIIKEKFNNYIKTSKLKMIEGDILDKNILETIYNLNNYKVIANIPYYITGEIFRQFLSAKNKPLSMTLLVQKEVAERIMARDKKESILSLSIKYYGKPSIITKVSRGNFFPKPNVDSAVLLIKDIKQEGETEEEFFALIKSGFAHKRKFLKNNLLSYLTKDKIELIWKKMNLSDSVRAEDLNKESWLIMAEITRDLNQKDT